MAYEDSLESCGFVLHAHRVSAQNSNSAFTSLKRCKTGLAGLRVEDMAQPGLHLKTGGRENLTPVKILTHLLQPHAPVGQWSTGKSGSSSQFNDQEPLCTETANNRQPNWHQTA